ncbi:MAG: ATP-binding protein [Candidatus Omnitrophota bacterium]
MLKLSIRTKIIIAFFILIMLSVSFLLISFPSLSKINALSFAAIPLSREINILQDYDEGVKYLANKIELYFNIRSEETKGEVLAAVKQVNVLATQHKQEKALSPLAGMFDLVLELNNAVVELMSYMDKSESAYKINLQIVTVNKLFEAFDQMQNNLQEARLVQLQKNVHSQTEITRVLLDKFLMIEIFIIVVGLLSSIILSRIITRNLLKLRKGTQEIAEGNFLARIDISSGDEIEELARSFNMMADHLRKTTVSKDYMDNVIHTMAETLIVVNPDLTISSVNQATCGLLGYSESELIGKSVMMLFSVEGALMENVEFDHLIKDAKLMNCEINYRAKNGRKIPIILSTSAMKDKDNNTIRIICTATDIIERKIAEEKLKEVAELKSKLTSMVSHELRTPLAAIKTGISIVLDGLTGGINVEQKEVLDIVKTNVDRLARLINDVLDFHKLESKKMQLKMDENDIAEVIREIYDTMNPMVEQKGLTFILNLSAPLPKVIFDRDRMIQVLSNLVNNAIKFTQKGSITITAEKESQGLHVAVIDTGIGIKQEDIARLFHSFEQLETPDNAKIEGTGLGLAICNEIIEQHGGEIWVESEIGKGSFFHFIIPFQR